MKSGQKHVVILGGGTAGTLTANKLRKGSHPDELAITVVDRSAHHYYQPGLLFVPFGKGGPDDLARDRRAQLRAGITYVDSDIDRVETSENKVFLADGAELTYDVLAIATGARLLPDETEGLLGTGWMEKVFTFYDPPGAEALAAALERFAGGTVAINIVDMPIKCPVAPLEFAFLADAYFTERGIRDKVRLLYVTPLDGAFTKPFASEHLGNMLVDRGVELVTEFNTGEVDGAQGKLIGFDGREVQFDLGVVVPLHGGAEYVGRSPGLGDELDFVLTDERTLQSKAAPNVFAIGDATNLAASKAGSVAHFQGEILVENIRHLLADEPLEAGFDGHANCFIESGSGKALLIDFNYDTEPLPGRYPTAVGLPLLKESRLNHLGKLMFQWFYWHVLLPGRSVPGIGARMPHSGKKKLPIKEGSAR
jgi:sulfide:quinone oxidoreductase